MAVLPIGENLMDGSRQTASVPVFTLFIELDDSTLLQEGLMTKLSENPTKIAVKLARPMRLQSSKQ